MQKLFFQFSERGEVVRGGDLPLDDREIDGCVHLTDGTAQPGDFVRAWVRRASDYDLVASLPDPAPTDRA